MMARALHGELTLEAEIPALVLTWCHRIASNGSWVRAQQRGWQAFQSRREDPLRQILLHV